MSTSEEFMVYLSDQLRDAGIITYRKMFGEYALYCDSKVIGLVCDGQFFLKKTDAGRKLLKEVCEAPAYNGAKPSFLITSTDDREYLTKLVRATCSELPYPKQKKKKEKNNCDSGEYVCYCSKVTEKRKLLQFPKSTPVSLHALKRTFFRLLFLKLTVLILQF